MKKVGWVQWEPGQKHHFIVQRPDGWYWTACERWGTDYHYTTGLYHGGKIMLNIVVNNHVDTYVEHGCSTCRVSYLL